jgi:hypothetical protein
LTGLPLHLSLLGGLADVIQLGIPMLLYRLLAPRFGINEIGKDAFTVKGFIFFTIMSLFNFLGGALGIYVLVLSDFVPMDKYLFGLTFWAVSNIGVLLLTGPLILTNLSPIVERYGLTVRNLLN